MNSGRGDKPESGEPFLARWSRRKLQPERIEGAGEKPPAAPAGTPAEVVPESANANLPDVESLDGLRSDYQAFMRPGVGDAARRGALKMLFSDPHFNVMDGLDTYIDDYSIEDPIPDAMLRGLNQARSMMLFEEKKENETTGDSVGAGQPEPAPEDAGAKALAHPDAATGVPESAPMGRAADDPARKPENSR